MLQHDPVFITSSSLKRKWTINPKLNLRATYTIGKVMHSRQIKESDLSLYLYCLCSEPVISIPECSTHY